MLKWQMRGSVLSHTPGHCPDWLSFPADNKVFDVTEEGVAVNSGNSAHADFHTPFQTITAETSCTTAGTLCPPSSSPG